MTRLVLDHEVPGGYREAEWVDVSTWEDVYLYRKRHLVNSVDGSERFVDAEKREPPPMGLRVESVEITAIQDELPSYVYLLDLPAREAGYLAERVDRVMEDASREVAPSMSQTYAAWKVFDEWVEGLLRHVGSYQIVEATYDAAWDVVSLTRLDRNTDDFEVYHRSLIEALAEARDGYDGPHVELLLRIALCKAVVCLILNHKSRGVWVSETEDSLRRSLGEASHDRYSVSFGFGGPDVGIALAASFRANGAYESIVSTAEE